MLTNVSTDTRQSDTQMTVSRYLGHVMVDTQGNTRHIHVHVQYLALQPTYTLDYKIRVAKGLVYM